MEQIAPGGSHRRALGKSESPSGIVDWEQKRRLRADAETYPDAQSIRFVQRVEDQWS